MSVRTFVAALAALLVASACTTTADTSVEPPPSSAVETVETAPAASGAELRIAMAEPESLHPHHVVSDRAVELAGLLHRPLTVRGAGFYEGTTVKLTREHQPDLLPIETAFMKRLRTITPTPRISRM